MSRNIVIDEVEKSYRDSSCVGDRLYYIKYHILDVYLRMTGDLRRIAVGLEIKDGAWGKDNYILSFVLTRCEGIWGLPFDSTLVTRVEVFLSSVELSGKRLEITIDSSGMGSMFYEGLRNEIVSNVRGFVHGVYHRVSALSNSNNAKDLLKLYNWEQVPIVICKDCVLFDTGDDYYVKLREDVEETLLCDPYSEKCVGYRLKHNATYFIAVEENKRPRGINYCVVKDGVALGSLATIVNKRLL